MRPINLNILYHMSRRWDSNPRFQLTATTIHDISMPRYVSFVVMVGFEPTFDVISRYQLQFSKLSAWAATPRLSGRGRSRTDTSLSLLTVFKTATTTNWLALPEPRNSSFNIPPTYGATRVRFQLHTH